MAVELTAQVEGKQPGDTYSGNNEQWLLDNGYAREVKQAEKPKPATRKPAPTEK